MTENENTTTEAEPAGITDLKGNHSIALADLYQAAENIVEAAKLGDLERAIAMVDLCAAARGFTRVDDMLEDVLVRGPRSRKWVESVRALTVETEAAEAAEFELPITVVESAAAAPVPAAS